MGLGFAAVESYINQPLLAKIEIKHLGQVAPEDIKVYLSSALDFQRFGIEKTYFLRSLNFKVLYEEGQNAYIHVTTKNPIKEPLVDFVITVQWPEGNITRDYSLFLNPNPIINQPKIDRFATKAKSERNPPASTKMQAIEELSYEFPSDQIGEYGPTRNGESISMIASRVRPDDSYSIQRIMRELHRMNPDAFITGDINRLKMGKMLKIPPLMRSQFKKSDAPMTFEEQLITETKKPKPAYQPEQISLPESVMSDDKEDSELRLLSGGDQADLDMLEIENPTQDDIDKVSNQLIKVTLERVKRLKEENLALRKRFEMLVERMEEAVEKNARLDEQLAALQNSNQAMEGGKEIYKDIDAEVDQSLADSIPQQQENKDDSKDEEIIKKEQQATASSSKDIAKQEIMKPAQNEADNSESKLEQKTKPTVQVKTHAKEQEDSLLDSLLKWVSETLSIWYLVIAAVVAAIIAAIKFIFPKFKDKGIMDKFSLYRKYKSDSLTTDDDIDDIDLDLFETKEESKPESKDKNGQKIEPAINDKEEIEELEISNAGTLSGQEDAIDDLDDIFGEPNMDEEQEAEPDHGSSVQNSALSNDSQINFNDILGTTNSASASDDNSSDGVDIISQSSVYFAYGKFDLAEKLILDGLETDPENKKYKLKLMECYAKMDNEENFLSYLTKVSELYSGDEEFRSKIQKMYHDRWKKELY